MHRLAPLWPLALALALLAAFGARGQDASTQKAKPIEYRLLKWSEADTLLALRKATGDQVANLPEMLTELASEVSPNSNPALVTAVERQLEKRLQEVGAEGWDVVWVRESTNVIEGYVLPAPAIFLKR